MRVREVIHPDDEDALRWSDRAKPALSLRDLLIRIKTSGLDHRNLHRQGNSGFRS
jgi:hypothetical protein